MNIRLFSIVFSAALGMLSVSYSGAQDVPGRPPVQPPRQADPGSTLPAMNPAMLLRLRNQLTFELQQTERTLGFIDPSDTQLTTTLQDQRTELLNQLKEITTQLKAQGVPDDLAAGAASVVSVPQTPTESSLPAAPKAADPTLVPGGLPQAATDPNLLIQRAPGGMTPAMPSPGLPPGFNSPADRRFPPLPQQAAPVIPGAPTEFDQERAWADSPWTPQPSRELSELKQTIDTLRKEVADMKETIKALETQIQLLNRNILLSQPAAKQP